MRAVREGSSWSSERKVGKQISIVLYNPFSDQKNNHKDNDDNRCNDLAFEYLGNDSVYDLIVSQVDCGEWQKGFGSIF